MTRTEIRELLMQMLYEMDVAKTMDADDATRLAEQRLPQQEVSRAVMILGGIVDNLNEIDTAINVHSCSWETNRMPKVDLAIMRLALGEIKYAEDVPEAVAINEAINLAKKFSTEQSSSFIHGVLGAIVNGSQEQQ